ncbi:hypothetical protein Fcan01_11827 [Folsomia candida]|uniref:Uncharacterized protein n=1 Tax=Folsomia candida TaxID=158441 RepID=A0A226E9I5_FOLCA|nr:hypothetical protein Fcan01_11827 [Folsomia candida]
MESVPSTSTSRGRKHRASLSVEDMEKLRAADRLRKSRKKDEVNRQVIPATILCVYLFADMEVRDCRRMPLSSTERSRIHRAGESLNATERRRRSDRIRAQQNRAAETEQVEAARKAKIADRLRQVRLSQENADPPEIQSLDSLDEISIDEHYCGKMSIICASCSSRNFPGEVTSNDTSFTKCSTKMLHEVEIEAEEEARRQNQPKSLLFMAIVQTKERDIIRYNAPRANEVAIVFQGDDGEPPLNSSEKRSLQSFSPIHKED